MKQAKKMWTVTFTVISKPKVEIEADTREEAEQKAADMDIRDIEALAYSQGSITIDQETDAEPHMVGGRAPAKKS